MNKEIEIPEGYEVKIENNKVILVPKESEDERIRKELLEEIEFIIPHDDETDSEGLILPSYHARIDRYKSYLEKQKEQKPAEWSEEDEDKVDDICKLIEHATIIPRSGDDDTGIPPTRLNDKYKGELKAFVKSLRNLPTKSDTWKLNEEQMEALRAAMEHNVCYCGCNHHALKSLYNDLQKLL